MTAAWLVVAGVVYLWVAVMVLSLCRAAAMGDEMERRG